jgi:hypothetical protein
MAKQGNYITAPTSNANWAAGFADSLSDLSDNYRDQATTKKDSELAAEALAYNRGRDATADSQYQDRVALAAKHYDTAQGRLDLTAKGVADKEALKASQIDWITKNLGGFSNAAAQQQKAESLGSNAALEAKHGLDPNLLRHRDQYGYESDRDRLLGSTPLYQEEVRNNLAKKYLAEYGTAIDPKALATVGTDLTSSVAQQATENASAEAANAREAANKESIRANFNAAKTTMEFKNNATAGKGTSKGAPNAYSNILVTDLLGGKYTEGSWFLPFDDELNQAADLTQSLLKQSQKAGIPANEAIIGVKKALDLLTTGGDLQSIDNDPGKAFRLVNESIAEYRSAVKSNKTDNEQFKLLEQEFYKNAAKSQYYTPKNMKVEAQKPFQKIMDELQGKTPATTTDSASAVTAAEKPKVGASNAASNAALTALITGNLANGVSGTVTSATPGAVDTSGAGGASSTGSTDGEVVAPLNREQALEALTSNSAYTVSATNSKKMTPTSSIAVKQSHLDGLQQDLYRATDAKDTTNISAIMGDMDKLQNNISNAKRFKKGSDLVDRVNAVIGKDGITTDTLFVLPYDKNGNAKSWADTVKDINSRDSINFGDGIGRKEYEEALDNPELQQATIAKVNKLIGNDAMFRASTAKIMDKSVKGIDEYIVTPIKEALQNVLDTSFDPTSIDYTNSVSSRAADLKRPTREDALNDVQSFVNEYNGLPNIGEGDLSSGFNAFTSSVSESPSMQNVLYAGAAPYAAAYGVKGAIGATRLGIGGTRAAARGVKSLVKPKVNAPKFAAPKPSPMGPNPVPGFTKPVYNTPAVNRVNSNTRLNRLELNRLQEWYRKNANPFDL